MANLRYSMFGKITWVSVSDPTVFYEQKSELFHNTGEAYQWLLEWNKILWHHECKMCRGGVEYRLFRFELEMLNFAKGTPENPLGLDLKPEA